jgi:mono/diheme cytochrome c family protein
MASRPGSRIGRVAVAAAATGALSALGVACGADGPTTEIERGERIYSANCAQCHGADLTGTDHGPSLLLAAYGPDELSDADIAGAVRDGVEQRLFEFGPMAGNGALDDEQIDAVIAVVRAEQARSSPAD